LNFDFSEDQRLLQTTVRDFVADHETLQRNRNILESDAHYDPELWKSAAELGWLGAVIPEQYGGAGFGYLELVLIAEEVGRGLLPIPFSSSVYLATESILLCGSEEQKGKYLAGLAAGDRIGTLAIAEGIGHPGPQHIQTSFEGGKLNGTKIAVPDGSAANLAVVVAKAAKGISLAVVDLTAAGVDKAPADSIDPTRSGATISFSDAPAELLGTEGEGWELARKVLDRAAILMAFEQVGGADAAFDITREYMLGRYAYGRPVASFQALKHRMADMYVARVLARSNSYYGGWALENDADELGLAACAARVSATEAFDLCSVEMIQLHGGVGFTWEYDCHMFYRRAKHLAVVLGSPDHWRDKLIQHLTAKQASKAA
jgi:alkylation response protein AidB-like acyl-CoA dehydrogenase